MTTYKPASKPMNFENLGLCFFEEEEGPPRSPKSGEFFMSGAIPAAYLHRNDSCVGRYRIVRPTHKAIRKTAYSVYAKGAAI
jgi:hypothetical protein